MRLEYRLRADDCIEISAYALSDMRDLKFDIVIYNSGNTAECKRSATYIARASAGENLNVCRYSRTDGDKLDAVKLDNVGGKKAK